LQVYQTFYLCLQARRASEREEARRRQIAAKEGFMALLEDAAELEPGDTYDRASRLLNHDGRWKVSNLQSVADDGLLSCSMLNSMVGQTADITLSLLLPAARLQEVESDALRRELFKDHMEALKRRR
jgi:hypothetical protein